MSLEDYKAKIRPQMFDLLELSTMSTEVTDRERDRLREKLESLAAKLLKSDWRFTLSPKQRQQLLDELLNELLGFGPLEPLMQDKTISEIIVNGPSQVFIERHGRIERTSVTFRHRDALLYVIERILSSTGRRVTQAEPYADARLPDGSRVNIVVEPVAVEGPYVTIRKRTFEAFSMDRLLQVGTLTPEAARFLEVCVQARLNLVISGGASSGKTTLMNVLANLIPPHERIVLIEDTAEVQLPPDRHVARLETRPPSIEWRGEVTIRHLVKNALHMRPDRILVGEARGEEALDMLQAMSTGHDGSMTTLHANTPLDALSRMETMALMSHLELSYAAVQRQVRSAVDLIVHMARRADGNRQVAWISAVDKQGQADAAPLTDLFVRTGRSSESPLVPTEAHPAFVERLMQGVAAERGKKGA